MRKHEDDAILFIERLRQVYQDKGYAFFDKGDYNLNIVGIRNMTTGKADKFDELFNEDSPKVEATTEDDGLPF